MIGVKTLNNFGGIIVLGIDDEIVEYYYDFGGENISPIYKQKLEYDKDGKPYFETKEGNQYLDEFMTSNKGDK